MKPAPRRVDHAADVLLTMVDRLGYPVLGMSASSAWDLFVGFAEVPFAVPAIADADGLLYQFGVYEFTGTPMFHLDLVRQFAVADADEYVQVHLELVFELDDHLVAVAAHNEWWWPEDSVVLRDWSRSVRRRPEWLELNGRVPTDVRIYQHET
ncbi:hypothetical protein [Kutzneria buriramensis]|nr:hypothetical protein [Kutzneria buriramensis]